MSLSHTLADDSRTVCGTSTYGLLWATSNALRAPGVSFDNIVLSFPCPVRPLSFLFIVTPKDVATRHLVTSVTGGDVTPVRVLQQKIQQI